MLNRLPSGRLSGLGYSDLSVPQPSSTSAMLESRGSISDPDSDAESHARKRRTFPRVAAGEIVTRFEKDSRKYPTFDQAVRALTAFERQKTGTVYGKRGTSSKKPLPKSRPRNQPMGTRLKTGSRQRVRGVKASKVTNIVQARVGDGGIIGFKDRPSFRGTE